MELNARTRRARPARTRALLLVGIVLLFAQPATAATYFWNVLADADWDVGANWSGGVEPGAADTASIGNGFGPIVSTTGNQVGTLNVGSTAVGGRIQFTGAGSLAVSNSVVLGASPTLTGTGVMNGTGTLSTNNFNIGNGGTGAFTISAGSVTANSSILGLSSTGVGALIVSGSSARATFANNFVVGQEGDGSLDINSGGQVAVNSQNFHVARNAGSTGTLLIDGPNSRLDVTATNPTIGNGSGATAEVHITNGGVLSVTGALATGGSGATTTMTVDGAGSQLSATGILFMGTLGGTSALDITNGGAASSGGFRIGNGGTGTMMIDGAGSSLLSQSTSHNLGYTSTGTVNVLNGGTLTVNDGTLSIGSLSGGDGTLNLDGDGSLLTGSAGVVVGAGGTGAVNVTNGADIVLLGRAVSIGQGAGSDGAVTLTDAGSTMSAGAVVIGTLGNGAFNLFNSAELASDSLVIAARPGSVGTLNLGDGGVAPIVTVDVIEGGAGDGTINFNHSDAAYTFASPMTGILNVNLIGTGTTVFTGDSTYAGLTTIGDGVLRFGNGGPNGGIQSDILNNGDLIVDRSNTYLFEGTISGVGNFTQNGTGRTIFTADHSYSGTTTVTNGTLQLGNGGAIGSVVGDIANDGNVTFARSGLYEFESLIVGAGSVTQDGPGITKFVTAQPYTGATIVTGGELRAGVADVIVASSGLSVRPGAIFSGNGFDQGIASLENNGIVNLFGVGPDANLTIVGDLSGSGVFGMTTDVAAGVSDHIDVQGASSGEHLLAIINTGGVPANLGAALEVVSTVDGVATFAAEGGKVDIGVYAYEVIRGNGLAQTPDPTNWYLVFKPGVLAEAARAVLDTAAGLSLTWFTQMDNLHRRMGQQRLINPQMHRYEVWMRGYARDISVDDSVSGRPFDEDISGIDAGIDSVVYGDDNNTVIAGVFGGYGEAERTFNDIGSIGKSEAPYGGLYATWFDKQNYYIDLTFKAQHFENSFNAIDDHGNGHYGAYDNWGVGVSIEGGRRFGLGGGWSVQPQAQMQYLHLAGQDYATQRGTVVSVNGDDVFQFRGGVEGGITLTEVAGGILYPYARASLVATVGDGGAIRADALRFDPDLDGAAIEYGAGVIYQADGQAQIYAAFVASEGEHVDQNWGVNAGVRFEF